MSFTASTRTCIFAFALVALLESPTPGLAQQPPSAIRIETWLEQPQMKTTDPQAEHQPALFLDSASNDPGKCGTAPTVAASTCGCDNHPTLTGRVILYAWVPGVHGHVTIRDRTARTDFSIAQQWDLMIYDLDFAAIGQVELYYGNFGVIFNGVYDKESPGTTIDHLSFNGGLKTTVLDLVATYNLEGVTSALSLPSCSRFELLAGVRYYELGSSLTLSEDRPPFRTVSESHSREWMDPIVGFRARFPIFDGLTGQFRGDVGGFDLPQSSKFSWNIEATVEYCCSERASLFGGWRWLDIDRQRGSGVSHFGFDNLLSGPLAGLVIKF